MWLKLKDKIMRKLKWAYLCSVSILALSVSGCATGNISCAKASLVRDAAVNTVAAIDAICPAIIPSQTPQ